MRSLWGIVLAAGLSGCSLGGEPPAVLPPRPVLIVIAPVDFYYQEYGDPRRALEEAGLSVRVASSTTDPATPHSGSWEVAPANGGVVTPDLALGQASASDYSALVISGGWGAMRYFYAFTGDADNDTYDPNEADKTAMNALINAFLAAGKPILGVCNGVNVLSWARVTGTQDSPLKGRKVSAPYLDGPVMVYAGRRWTDEEGRLVLWTFATDNGAVVAAHNSVGDAANERDDVSRDGPILTAQDQLSAYAGGRALASLLGP